VSAGARKLGTGAERLEGTRRLLKHCVNNINRAAPMRAACRTGRYLDTVHLWDEPATAKQLLCVCFLIKQAGAQNLHPGGLGEVRYGSRGLAY